MKLDIYNDIPAITSAISALAIERSRNVVVGSTYVRCSHFHAFVYDDHVWACVPEKSGNSLTLSRREAGEICGSLESVFIDPFDKWK